MGVVPRRLAAALCAAGLALLGTQLAGAEPAIVGVVAIPRVLDVPAGIDAPFESLSCTPSTMRCTAVGPGSFSQGPSLPGAGRPTVLATSPSGAWVARTGLATPAGEGDGDVELNGVSCTSGASCTAVGSHLGSRLDTPIAFDETGGAWQRGVAVQLPAAAHAGGDLAGVWCASAGNCVAAGWYPGSVDQVSSEAMSAVELDGTWQQATALPAVPAGVTMQLAVSISCSAIDDCTMLGIGSGRSGAAAAIAWTETAGTWGAATIVRGAPGTYFVGFSVACTSPGTCVAVGGLGGDHPSPQPAAALERSGVWSPAARVPTPRLSPLHGAGLFVSVSCSSASECVAVGYLATGVTELDAAAATMTGGRWSSMDEIHATAVPPRTSSAWAVSCPPAASTCEVVGSYATSTARVHAYGDFAARVVPVRTPVAPAPPEDLAVAPERGRVRVSWQPPPDDGGSPVTSYTATVSPGGRTCSTRAGACTIGGLRVGARYRVSVVDHTRAGTSPQRDAPSFVAGVVPTAPHSLTVSVAGDALVVTWRRSDSPATEPVGAYVVTAYRLTPAGERVEATRGTRALGCTLARIAPGQYEVVVTARDASGTSAPASVLTVVR